MPVLPLIDLLILVAWTSLIVGFVQKALWLALASRFTILGLVPVDFLMLAGVGLLFALALAARVWVKANEPALLRAARRTPRERETLPDFPHPAEDAALEEEPLAPAAEPLAARSARS